MNKFGAIIRATLLCLLSSAYSCAGATGATHPNSFANKDGTTLSTAFSAQLQAYEVYLAKRGETLLIHTLTLEFQNKGMHSVSTSDFNGDGYGDVILQGDCGNRACMGSVYFFDPGNKSLRKAFTKEFSNITPRDGLVILGSGSGCCSFEYQAIRLSADRMSVDLKPAFYVVIEAPSAGSEKSRCSFLDSNFADMPAQGALLDLCTVYGQSFEIESSDSRR
jgi:hypothetical protein